MNLTPNFTLKEFQTHDGEQVPESLHDNLRRLCRNLEVLRAHLGKPIIIVSGWRSPAYNTKIGGAPKSQHMTALAADIRVGGITEEALLAAVEHLIAAGKMEQGGVGIYADWLHVDVRGRRSRWDNRATGKRG